MRSLPNHRARWHHLCASARAAERLGRSYAHEVSAIPDVVLERIAATVAEVIATPELGWFAIGSSDRRAPGRGEDEPDAVIDVFRTHDAEEARAVEEALWVRFAAHEKARPAPLDASAPATDEALILVYLALWAAPGV